jgi:oligopeptide/dipeptide ABC transporter ATP-binding protein
MVCARNWIRALASEPLLQVRDLVIEFPTPRGVVRAVDGVSFDLQPGERLAIVGESGSGKSVLSSSLLQLVPHPGRIVQGSALLEGRDLLSLSQREMLQVRGKSATMVFQDPMSALNPVLRVGEQLVEPIRRHLGLDRASARQRAIELLGQTGFPDPRRSIDAYPHELSGGMRQRVLIAMALACAPRLLIADEPTTALDVTIQAQIVVLLRDMAERLGSSVIFVTHDLGLVARFAHRVAVMYAGRIVECGPVRDIFRYPEHPYTRGLLASLPRIDGPRAERLWQIEGSPPDLSALGDSCAFAPRCPSVLAQCSTARPPLEARSAGHTAACWVSAAVEMREVSYAH